MKTFILLLKIVREAIGHGIIEPAKRGRFIYRLNF
jgi:hypothetical protein